VGPLLLAETDCSYAPAISEGVAPAAVCALRFTRHPWPTPTGVDLAVPVMIPTVNQGRWILTCLDPTCRASQLASKVDPRFFCADCGNRRSAGRWLRVVFPFTAPRIEDALAPRRWRSDQNWRGELPAQLLDDNVTRGFVSP
jgi:hypothetical protein